MVFKHKLRRKAWTAVVDLDLVACTERSVPSMIFGLFVDIKPPMSSNDRNHIANTEIEPAEQPGGKL